MLAPYNTPEEKNKPIFVILFASSLQSNDGHDYGHDYGYDYSHTLGSTPMVRIFNLVTNAVVGTVLKASHFISP